MGFAFLVCGTTGFYQRQNSWNYLFFLYCAFASIHWAGPIGEGEGVLGFVLLSCYVLVGVALFASVFLHMAVVYPSRRIKFPAIVGIYLNSVLAALSIAFASTGLFDTEIILLNVMLGSILGVFAGAVWLLRLWVTKSTNLSKTGSAIATFGLLVGSVSNLLAQNELLPFGEYSGSANLSLLFTIGVFFWLSSKS